MAVQPELITDLKVLLLHSGQSLEMETQWCWVRGGKKNPFASHLITSTPVIRLLLNYRKTEPYRANFIHASVTLQAPHTAALYFKISLIGRKNKKR